MTHPPRIAAVVPCYRVRAHIMGVLERLVPVVDAVFVVDDACPDGTADHVRRHAPGVHILPHATNQGVGAAVVTGYRAALAAGFDIVVKLDGDGQMDPADLPALLRPLLEGAADYAKGNRLATRADRVAMPASRVVGNVVISWLARRMTGRHALSDPMNGYTAMTAGTLAGLPLDALDRGFFFETDVLVRLSRLGARIVDVPMPARYGRERSNLGPAIILRHFPAKIAARLLARLAGR